MTTTKEQVDAAMDIVALGRTMSVGNVCRCLEEMKSPETETATAAAARILAARVKELDAENITLREIVSNSVAALGTGAACKPECSLEFMTYVPDEIRLVVRKLEQQVSALRELEADKERLDFIESNVRQAHVNGHHRVELTIFTARDVEQKGLRATIDAARHALWQAGR